MKTSGAKKSLQPSCGVLVVDPWVSIHEMLALVFQKLRRWKIAGNATSVAEGLRLFQQIQPDIVITSLRLPEGGGAELIGAIRRENPAARVVVYTAATDRQHLQPAFRSHPQGFVHKSESVTELQKAVRIVREGGDYFSPEGQRLRDLMDAPNPPDTVLTSRQRDVLKLIAESVHTKQIAARLSISPKTVENYRGQFAQRLGLRDVAALTRYAMQTGLIDLGDETSATVSNFA